MITFIHCKNLYNDVEQLSKLINSLEFSDTLHGKEVEEFFYIPEGLSEMFSKILNESIEIQPNTGTFRKPNSIVHFDNFYQHSLWSCIVALEDTKIKLHKHESGSQSFFDIETENKDQFFIDNCMSLEKWEEESVVVMRKNDFVFVRPWLWKSFEEEKVIQVFMLNTKLEGKE